MPDRGNIALVDYGAGNLTSVRKALAAIGAEVWSPRDPGEIARAAGVIVPGVGHFAATAALGEAWRAALREHAARERPLLGICLGLQWLYEGSAEAPDVPGLGLLPGRCQVVDAPGLKIPHVGWNTVRLVRDSELTAGLPGDPYVYFTHSYAAPLTPDTVATTTYGPATFASIAARGRVFGVQFHPEKSAGVGLSLLRRFAALCGREAATPGPDPAPGPPTLDPGGPASGPRA